MGVGTSLVIFAVGAVLRFAVSVTPTGINLHEVGVILMIVAAVGFVVSLIFWRSWGGFGGFHRQSTTMRDPRSGITTSRDDTVY